MLIAHSPSYWNLNDLFLKPKTSFLKNLCTCSWRFQATPSWTLYKTPGSLYWPLDLSWKHQLLQKIWIIHLATYFGSSIMSFIFFLCKNFKLKNYVVLYYKYIVVIVILADWFVIAFCSPNTNSLTKGAVFPHSLLCPNGYVVKTYKYLHIFNID